MSDEFTHKVFRIVIAKLLKQFKFKTASESSLDVLVDYAINRLFNIAKQAANRAAFCGRTDVNAYDLIISLAENQCPLSHLINFYTTNLPKVQFPFDYIISPYPIISNSSFYQKQVKAIKTVVSQHMKKKPSNQIGQPKYSMVPSSEQADNIVDAIANEIFIPFRSNTTSSYFQFNNPNMPNIPTSEPAQPNSGAKPFINVNTNGGNAINPNFKNGPLTANPFPMKPSKSLSSNSAIKSDDTNFPQIPAAFPRFPPQYTYDETPMKDALSSGEIALLDKSHEDDQRESKESLAQLNKSSISEQLYDTYDQFETDLLTPPEIDIPIGKCYDWKKSGIYSMDGERPEADPEFMPPLKVKEDIMGSNPITKETKVQLGFLATKHTKKDEGKNDE